MFLRAGTKLRGLQHQPQHNIAFGVVDNSRGSSGGQHLTFPYQQLLLQVHAPSNADRQKAADASALQYITATELDNDARSCIMMQTSFAVTPLLGPAKIITSSPWSSPPRQQHIITPGPTHTDQDHTAREHPLCDANPTATHPYASRGISPRAPRPKPAAVAALAQPAVCKKSAVQRPYEKLKYAAQPRQSNKQHKYHRVFPQSGKQP